MDGAEWADKTAENPAQQNSEQQDPSTPQKSLDERMPRDQGRQDHQWVHLEEEPHRVIKSQVLLVGKHKGILEVKLLGKTAFHEQEKKEQQKETLADSSQPDQVFRFHRETLFRSSD
jgi:hypothetical protein